MRVKTGITRRKRHKKIREQTKGFLGHRRRTIVGGKEAVTHALHHAYVGRRLKKRDFRVLWIQRINAALRKQNLSYSRFLHIMRDQNVILDRKILSNLAVSNSEIFEKIVAELTTK